MAYDLDWDGLQSDRAMEELLDHEAATGCRPNSTPVQLKNRLQALYREAEEHDVKFEALSEKCKEKASPPPRSARVNGPEDERRRKEIKLLFQRWDVEGEGNLVLEDLKTMLTDFEKASHLLIFPPSGAGKIDCDMFVDTVLRALRPCDGSGFDSFVKFALDSLNYVSDLTPLRCKTNTVWRLFNLWDADHSGSLEFIELEAVIRNTPFFLSGGFGMKELAAALSDEPVPESSRLFEEHLRKMREELTLDLKGFHRFLNKLTLKCSEQTFYEIIRQISTCISSQKRQYAVTKYLTTATLTSEDRYVHSDEMSEQEERYNQRERKILSVKRDLQHALDGLSRYDIEISHTIEQMLVETFEPVSAAACILLNIPPTKDGEYYQNFCEHILQIGAEAFLERMSLFEAKDVTFLQMRCLLQFYYKPQFDANRLLCRSYFFTCLANWVKLTVKLVSLLNGWDDVQTADFTSSNNQSASAPKKKKNIKRIFSSGETAVMEATETELRHLPVLSVFSPRKAAMAHERTPSELKNPLYSPRVEFVRQIAETSKLSTSLFNTSPKQSNMLRSRRFLTFH